MGLCNSNKKLYTNTSKKLSIGFFCSYISTDIGSLIHSGISEACKHYDINLLSFVGKRLKDPNDPNSSYIFDLANNFNLDGLIVWSTTLAYNPNDPESLFFYKKFCKTPILSIGMPIDEGPSIMIDNVSGIFNLFKHFYEVHGYRKIGFITAKQGHPYTEERLRGYKKALKHYNIAYKDSLVSPYDDWYQPSGEKAIEYFLLDKKLKPGVDIDAIISSGDLSAIGAINKLNSMGIKVPSDIAIVGFNNKSESRAIYPSLTTSDPDFYSHGYKAVTLLMEKIDGKTNNKSIHVNSKLIVRQSCGCFEDSVQSAKSSFISLKSTKCSFPGNIKNKRKTIIKNIKAETTFSMNYLERDLIQVLFDSFTSDILGKSNNLFLDTLSKNLNTYRKIDTNLGDWQNIISNLRNAIIELIDNENTLKNAEDIFHQARVLIDLSIDYAKDNVKNQMRLLSNEIPVITNSLNNSPSVESILNILNTNFPKLGVNEVYVVFFENYKKLSSQRKLVLALNSQNIFLEHHNPVFDTNCILPDFIDLQKPYSLAIYPLNFGENKFGYIIYECSSSNKFLFENITKVISSALFNSYTNSERTSATEKLRKSELKFRSMVETSSDWIWETNNQMVYTYSSPKIKDILGYTPQEVSNRTILDFVCNDSDSYITSILLKELIHNKSHLKKIQLKKRHKNGHFVIIETNAVPIYDNYNTFIGYQGIHRDITDHKKSEEERERLLASLENKNFDLENKIEERTRDIKKANAMLEKASTEAKLANEAKTRFLANVSHEIRTPLNCIIGFTEILQGSEFAENKNYYTNLILDQSDKLMQMINQLLDISKIEAGKLDLNIECFDFYEFMEFINTSFQTTARNKGLDFIINIDKKVPHYLKGDSFRLRQVLLNLIGNAIKFTNKGKIIITVDLIKSTHSHNTILFKISDTGIGIPADKINTIFEAFVQAEDSTTRNFGGTGLGTTISKQLVNLMNGDIGVISKPNEGSTFYFTVSFDIPKSSLESKPINSIDILLPKYIKKSAKVLLVEDFITNRQVASVFLKDLGCEVVCAENGKICIEKFLQDKFDLVLMDIHMPEMDGIDATKHLRNLPNGNEIAIIAITADAFESEIQKYLESGMNDFLTKPFRKKEFQEKILKWLCK